MDTDEIKGTLNFEYQGEDWWGNPVFKCLENGKIYKDVDWIKGAPNLHTCDNDIDGEPGFPIDTTGYLVNYLYPNEEGEYCEDICRDEMCK